MMKKLLSIMLCMILMLSCASSMGEDQAEGVMVELNDFFSLKCSMPEGYQISGDLLDGDAGVYLIQSEDANKPIMYLSVAFDELMSDVERMNDLDAETLTMLEDSFRAEDIVEITYTETALGTKLMVVKEVKDTVDFVDFFTIYKGYELEFVLISGNYGTENETPLTDEAIDMALKFLSDLEFVPVQ